jgi:hypothetical protein
MSEVDDRLAGDPVWELFPERAGEHGGRAFARRGYLRWLVAACLIALVWFCSPPVGVLTACLAVAVDDFRAGRSLARSIPDKAGCAICARFTYAWGAWKAGCAAFAAMFAIVGVFASAGGSGEAPPGFFAAMWLWSCSFLSSAALTASGLLKAYRHEMRVWIGEGINRARTLLLGMLIVTFVFVVLVPWSIWLVGVPQVPLANRDVSLLYVVPVFAMMFAGALAILMILDWLSRRVVADTPGKFGPKVSAVGKWKS